MGYPECAGIMEVSVLGLGTDCWSIQIVWDPDCHSGVSRLSCGVSRLGAWTDCGGIQIVGAS